MIKIKKVLTYVLSVSLMFSILGCSSKEDNKIWTDVNKEYKKLKNKKSKTEQHEK